MGNKVEKYYFGKITKVDKRTGLVEVLILKY